MAPMRRKTLVVGNWKMNPGTLAEAKAIFLAIRRAADALTRTEALVCVPAPFIEALSRLARGHRIGVAAQDVFWRNGGAFTGEISPEMLRSVGATGVLVGHSERRREGESDEIVARKALAALREGLSVILCVGERARDPDGAYLPALKTQLLASLAGVSRRYLHALIVAYEPVFAVGASFKNALTPREAEEMAIFIKRVLTDEYGEESVRRIPILYGGSVYWKNAAGFVSDGAVAGLLAGRESLDVEDFRNILKEIDAA